MNVTICQPEMACLDVQSDTTWNKLYSLLTLLVRGWVYRAEVPSWKGQEEDVAWDIVQAAMRKTYEYALKARRRGITIGSLERLSTFIARNQMRDQRRKDGRLLHIERDADAPEAETAVFYEEDDPAEAIVEQQYEAWLFCQVAEVVVLFPAKMREAILADLARRLEAQGELSGDLSPLRQAFLDQGIYLETFIHLLPADPAAKARHSSLASLAYKRIAKLVDADQS
jgi:DNA-directed RNA polymerase specialized sigma24 family protein